jgi:tRNA1Val (adenine37-N6)-methyltransferase
LTSPELHTHDSISLRGAGVVTVAQNKQGARFNLDSLLLADFCRIKPWDRILEPGTGTGIVSLLLAKKHLRSHLTAVEIQPSLARLCRRNIADNGLEDRLRLTEGDLRSLKREFSSSPFDVIVANPPYQRNGAGKQSPGAERRVSRQERQGNLSDWLDLQRFLKNGGRYVVIFPADRLADLLPSLQRRGLEPKLMRLIHPYRDKPASLALIESVKSAGTGLRVLPPLVVHEPGCGFTEEMLRIYGQSA